MRRFTLLASLALWAIGSAQSAEIAISDAWIAEAPPNAQVLAAYMVLRNLGTEPIEILGAKSRYFGAVEMHRSVRRANGNVGMAPLEDRRIAPGATLVFEPGANHFMLFRPEATVRAGQTLAVRLHFTNGDSTVVPLPVRRR